MKKVILIVALVAITTISFAQSKNTSSRPSSLGKGLKGDTTKTTVKKDSVTVDPNLHVTINKQDAIHMLPGLIASLNGTPEADNISAKDASEAGRVSIYFLKLIYKRWPDLIPKQ